MAASFKALNGQIMSENDRDFVGNDRISRALIELV